jgi:hypothetical protein
MRAGVLRRLPVMALLGPRRSQPTVEQTVTQEA